MQDFLRAAESQGIPTTDDAQDLVTAQYAINILTPTYTNKVQVVPNTGSNGSIVM